MGAEPVIGLRRVAAHRNHRKSAARRARKHKIKQQLDSQGVTPVHAARMLGVSDQRGRPIHVPRLYLVGGPAALGRVTE